MSDDLIFVERSAIGCMMLDALCCAEACEQLSDRDFDDSLCRSVYRAAKAISSSGSPVDEVTVHAELSRQSPVEFGDILSITETTPSTVVFSKYVSILIERSRTRALGAMASDISGRIQAGESAAAIIPACSEALAGISMDSRRDGIRGMRETLSAEMADLEKRYKGEVDLGCGTGIREIDDIIGGMMPGDMIVLAARPSMGKTAVGLQIARSIGSALICSLEMDSQTLARRHICAMTGITMDRMQRGEMRDSDWPRLAKSMQCLSELGMYTDDETTSIEQIHVRAKRHALRHELRAVVIDYLQLVGTSSKSHSREQEVANISKSCKQMARDLKVPVLVLAQLNRALEQRQNKRPMLSDLRESGAIEQDADKVLFLYRDAYYDADKQDDTIEIIVAKNRNGATGYCSLGWTPERMVIE